eukprot:m.24126 g.24126  ORF g.24126 m.24126 type:complete len:217 (+) comp9076_c0_seq1:228-878(+)
MTTEHIAEDGVPMREGVPNNIFNFPLDYDPDTKHPLEDKWALHFDDPSLLPKYPKPSDWKNNVKKLCVFKTVEDFWRVVKNIKKITDKEVQGSNMHFFRDGIAPEWEDPQNEVGGKWVFSSTNMSSKQWETTLLMMIGGGFGDNRNQVCGVVASTRIRRPSKISLWTRTCDEKIVMDIARRWKDALNLTDTRISFQPHRDAKASRTSYSASYSLKC